MVEFKSPPIHRTPLYRAKAAYTLMQQRCLNANGKSQSYADVELRMSLDEFVKWALPHYERFIAEHPDESPCVSRHGDKGHYEIGNIDIISMSENRRRQVIPKGSVIHGTLTTAGYCKCDACIRAKRRYNQEYYRRTTHKQPRVRRELVRGTVRNYANGCRCNLCRSANTDKAKAYRLLKEQTTHS